MGLFLITLGALRTGATWDEFGLARFLQSYLDTGWFTEPTALLDGEPDLSQIWYLYSYGPVPGLFGHWIAMMSGNGTLNDVALTAEAFAVRHLGSAFFAALGVAAVAFTSHVVLKSWKWGLLSAAILTSTPLWLGHGMFNQKDIPVASAFALTTLAATMWCAEPNRWMYGWQRLLPIGVLVSGLVIGAGTRPFAGVLMIASVVAALLFRQVWGLFAGARVKGIFRMLSDPLLGAVVAYVLLIAIYPQLFSDPVSLGIGSFLEARQFSFNESQIVAGTWISQPVPWWYLPVWFGAQLPLLVLFGAVAGLVSWFIALVQSLRGSKPVGPVDAVPSLFPSLIQAFGTVALAVIGQSVIYNGSRQYLFVVPALVVTATFGVYKFAGWFTNVRWARILLWTSVAIGLIVPSIVQIQMFPYGYSAYNALTLTLQRIDGNWPTDYWRASSREIMQRLPLEGTEACAYEQGLWNRTAPCSQEQMFIPYVQERGVATLVEGTSTDLWIVRENQGVVNAPVGCRVADAITRVNLWQRITIAQILECDSGTAFEEFAYPPVS